jgi:hypothetical protein
MKDLIKKILKEEAEVKEMGISMNKLRAAQPKNYLVKSLEAREKTAELKKHLKKITKKCNDLYSDIITDLKKIKWQDIILDEHEGFFYFTLPKKIINKMFQLCEYFNELEVNKSLNGLDSAEKVKQMCSDYNRYIYTEHIYLYLDYPRNRTHFPEGLPTSLLGFNLGVKIYRKILHITKFMQSHNNASPDAQELYRKLMQMPDINAVAYTDSVLLIEDGVPKEKVIEILTESIYEYYQRKPSRKLILNRTVIVSSKLIKLIGENNFLYMLYDLFYYAKKADREAFENIGYRIKGHKDDENNDYGDDDEDEYEGYEFTDIEDEDEEELKKQ